MAATKFLILLLTVIIQHLQMVGDDPDEATCQRMQQRAEQLSKEMARLLHELEQGMQEQMTKVQWTQEQMMQELGTQEQDHLLFGALQQWHFWPIAAILILNFGLCWCWCLKKTLPEGDSSSDDESSSSDWEQVAQGEEEDSHDNANDVGRFLDEHIQWPVQNLVRDCLVVKELVWNFIFVFREVLSNSFLPVLQPAIEVGSAFEGWSPREKDITYRFLVPLQPPYGHAFHLEPSTAGKMPIRNFYICVEVECTCTRERLAGEMLCFLHQPEPELRRNRDPSLLGILCTGTYLDVQKTARWFQLLVKAAWLVLPQSCQYRLKVLPSSRSCKFQVTRRSDESHLIELMFGVQQGNSDIFVSSESTEALFTPATMWPESYAVAEAKFFRHVARRAPHDSFHLKCLQLCARILVGIDFSTSTLKTVVMHLLTIIPLSGWRRRDLLPRLQDIMRYLHFCLERKRLDHFFLGNERVPEEIVLPPALQSAEPLNLFQHLAQDADAHAKALQEFNELQDRLSRLLVYGR